MTENKDILKYISDNIKKYSSFYIGELDLQGEPIVGGVGKLMVLANTFYETYCICEVWLSGDDQALVEDLTIYYEEIDIAYLQNVKTAVNRWVEIKSKEKNNDGE